MIHSHLAPHHHVVYADWELVGLLVRRASVNRRRIEDHEVGVRGNPDPAFVR
jgi:hypothetical protein